MAHRGVLGERERGFGGGVALRKETLKWFGRTSFNDLVPGYG
jgi:hypothetical protein